MRRFFSFKGRISRSHFWLYWLISIATFYGLICFFAEKFQSTNNNIYLLAFVILAQISLWNRLSLAVRRFHDMNLSGWASLVVIALPLIGDMIIGCIKGTKGANKYGPAAPVKADALQNTTN